MNPLFLLKERICLVFERKWAIIALLLLVLCSTMCGIVFIKTPSFYEYHLKVCDRFLDRVCYSDRSVFLIFLERTAGNVLVLALILIGGIHPCALVLPTTVLAFRSYTFGGTLAILFSVYGASGAFVAFALYLPIHLLVGTVFLFGGGLSFSRAFGFRFCAADFRDLLLDLALFAGIVALICVAEAIILGVLFHPLGILL